MTDGSPDFADEPIQRARRVLLAGGLVIVPTETVYGIAAHAAIPAAVERLYDVKRREPRKPIPLLAPDLPAVEAFGAVMDDRERRLAAAFWPGALTLILSLRGGGTEGFRIPDHAIALRLLRAVGCALRVTSCNLSGEPPALTAQEAGATLGTVAGCVLDGGPSRRGLASTVARVEPAGIRILRQGAVPPDALDAVLRDRADPPTAKPWGPLQ